MFLRISSLFSFIFRISLSLINAESRGRARKFNRRVNRTRVPKKSGNAQSNTVNGVTTEPSSVGVPR